MEEKEINENIAENILEIINEYKKNPYDIDVEKIFSPIADSSNPCGEYLRYEGIYDQILDAKKTEDANLPQGVWERSIRRADWKAVKEMCVDALINRSKDLQIAVWLMEALLHLGEFEGVKFGLKIINGLCDQFWDRIYPLTENGEVDSRILPFVWINEKFSIQMKLVKITSPQSKDSQAYSYDDWERANNLDKLSLKDKNALNVAEKEGKVTRPKFLGSVMFTPTIFYRKQSIALVDCLSEIKRLNAFLDKACGKDGPSFQKFVSVCTIIHEQVDSFLMEKSGEESQHESDDMGESQEVNYEYEYGKGGDISSASMPVRNRSEAYRMLTKAADYLLMYEPHSPTPYLVKRAVSWGHMTLTELLEELIADDHNLYQILNLLGIKGKEK
ncbi:MAG: type VI secretion system protein TssA [Desulfobacterales bacterium]|nr:type VI secretion system protein TssA [Desulfobacterales bacterium]